MPVRKENVPGIQAEIPLHQAGSQFFGPGSRDETEAADSIAIEELVDAIPSESIEIVATHRAAGLAGAGGRIDEVDARFGLRLQPLLDRRAEVARHDNPVKLSAKHSDSDETGNRRESGCSTVNTGAGTGSDRRGLAGITRYSAGNRESEPKPRPEARIRGSDTLRHHPGAPRRWPQKKSRDNARLLECVERTDEVSSRRP